jgi:replicative DNA helicase
MVMSDFEAASAARVPPHNLEAEESLLGAMLLSRDAIADAVEHTETEHFYRPANAHVFDAVSGLYASGDPADPVTVAAELERMGVLEMVGGLDGLISLQVNTPATSNASKYAQIVAERYLLRRLIETANQIADIGYSRPEDVARAVDEAENMMFQVAQGRVADSMGEIRDLLDATLDRLEHLYELGDGITGTPTGFIDLDELLSGLQPNALIIVGARPAMGKTAFALNIASHAAVRENKPVLIFSMEMGHLELTQRMLCSEANVDAKNMRDGKLNEDDWQRISNGIGRLAESPMWIDDNPNLTIMEIRAKARRLKSRAGDLGLVVVDYLQLMTGRSSAESRQVEVAEISRGLKILARELECPVLGLSQLSRNLEMRQDKRPMLADLRESGSIEQDADVVMFLYRDEVYHPGGDSEGMAEVIVAKHRNGPTGTIQLGFVPRFAAFRNLTRRDAV